MWYDSRYDECYLFKKISCTSIIKITVYFTFKCTIKFLKFLIQTIIYVCSMTPFGSLTSLISWKYTKNAAKEKCINHVNKAYSE